MTLMSDLISEVEVVATEVVHTTISEAPSAHPIFGSTILVNIRLGAEDLVVPVSQANTIQIPASFYFVLKSWYEEHGAAKMKNIFPDCLVCSFRTDMAFAGLGLTTEATETMDSMRELYYIVMPIKVIKQNRRTARLNLVPIGMKNVFDYESVGAFMYVRDLILCGRAYLFSSRNSTAAPAVPNHVQTTTWSDFGALRTAVNNMCALYGLEQLPEMALEISNEN